MKKVVSLVLCLVTICLLFGCSNNSETTSIQVKDGANESSESDYVVTKKLYCLQAWEGDPESASKERMIWKLSYSDISETYTFEVSGGWDNGHYAYNESGEFSKEKGDDVIEWFEKCEKEKYKPYHSNADGLMVTEYEPFNALCFYSLFDSEGKSIYRTSDPRYDKDEVECYFSLSENEYNALIEKFEDLKVIIESSNKEG